MGKAWRSRRARDARFTSDNQHEEKCDEGAVSRVWLWEDEKLRSWRMESMKEGLKKSWTVSERNERTVKRYINKASVSVTEWSRISRYCCEVKILRVSICYSVLEYQTTNFCRYSSIEIILFT